MILLVLLGVSCKPQMWTPSPPKPALADKGYNLRWDSKILDPNGAAVNPRWASQKPGQPANCSGKPFEPACTDQKVVVDEALATLPFCGPFSAASGNFPGHMDWSVAQYTGAIGWLNYAADFDFDFMLIPQDGSGLTDKNHLAAGVQVDGAGTGKTGYIELEFDSLEIAGRWQTSWWKELKTKADQFRIEGKVPSLNERDPEVLPCGVVLGIFGLDCEHGCASEVHPVYALAIQVDDRPQSNTWALFGRNWGTGGFCSRYDHQLTTAENKLWVLLPRTTAVGPTKISFETPQGTAAPHAEFWPGKGVAVQFQLPGPGQHGLADTVVKIEWPDSAGTFSCPVARYSDRELIKTIEDPAHPDSSEEYLRSLLPKGGAAPTQPSPPAPPPPVTSVVHDVQVATSSAPAPAAVKPQGRLSLQKQDAAENQDLIRQVCAAYLAGKLPADKNLSQACAKLPKPKK
jgi:hypothetical protein